MDAPAATLLAQVTFTNETASGWQRATFSSRCRSRPGTTYVASYYAPNGHYSVTGAGFDHRRRQRAAARARATRRAPTACTRTARRSRVPGQQLQREQLLGRRDVRADPGARRRLTDVTADGGHGLGDGQLDGPVHRRPVDQLRGHAVHRHDRADARRPSPARRLPTSTMVTGLTAGTAYTFKVRAANAERRRRASGGVQRRHARWPGGARRARPNVAAQPRPRLGARELDGAGATTAAAPITGYTVTPYIGATAQTPVDGSGSATTDGHRPDQRRRRTRSGSRATNAIGSSAVGTPRRAVTPAPTLFDFATPAASDAGDSNAVELGVKFKADVDGHGHRHPLLQGGRQHRHPRRHPVVGRRHAAWRGRRSRTRRPRAGRRCSSPRRSTVTAGTTYVASYYAPNGHYSATGAGASPRRSTTRRCTRSPTAVELQRRLRLRRRRRRSRRQLVQRRRTTGSTCCSRRRPSPGAPTGVTATAGSGVGDGRRGRRRRPAARVDVLRGHAVHRRDRADAEDRPWLAAGRRARR